MAALVLTIGGVVKEMLPDWSTNVGANRQGVMDMNIYTDGSYVPALDDEVLDRYLSSVELSTRTSRTISDASVLRAEVLKVRDQGWCLIDQELEDGVRSVAVPVHDAGGRVIAAINTSAHATRVTLATLRDDFLPALRQCARSIDDDLRAARR
jgi:IclR family pca regulon transcriptional regulator